MKDKSWPIILLAVLMTGNVLGQCTYNYMESKSGSGSKSKYQYNGYINKGLFIELSAPSWPPKFYRKYTVTEDIDCHEIAQYGEDEYYINFLVSHYVTVWEANRFTFDVSYKLTGGYSADHHDYGKMSDSTDNSQHPAYFDSDGFFYQPWWEWYFCFNGDSTTTTSQTSENTIQQEHDGHGTFKRNTIISDEYDTTMLKEDVKALTDEDINKATYKRVCQLSSISGSASLSSSEVDASKTDTLFRFKIPLSDKDTRYIFTWPVYTTTTTETTTTTATTTNSCSIDGNGGEATSPEQKDLVVVFPDRGRSVTKTIIANEVQMKEVSRNGSDGGCGSCGGSGGSGSGVGFLSLGYNTNGLPVGNISLDQSLSAPATPALLQMFAMSDDVNMVSNSYLRQLVASQMLIDIVSNTPSQFDINVYDVNHFGHTLAGGRYPVTAGGQFLTWRIENPGGVTDTNNLRMIEFRGGRAITNLLTRTNFGTTQMFGNGLKTIEREQFWNEDKTSRTEVAKTYDASHILVYSVSNVYSVDFTGERLESITEGIANAARTTTYGNGWVGYPDGSWEQSVYDDEGRLIEKKSSSGRHTTYDYSLLGGGDTNLLFAQGVARTITEYFDNTIVGINYRILTPSQRIEIQATTNAAWNYPGNLFTTNNYDADGRLTSTISPDQTIRWYTYNIGTVGRTNIVSTGYLSGNVYVTNQVTTTVNGLNGLILSTTTTENGLLTASTLYSEYDTLGRVGRIQYLDGTSVSYQYDCCGVASSTDRNGVTTVNTYNDLKQLNSKTEVGADSITWIYDYDPLDHLLSTKRQWVTLSGASFDTAGHQLTATNALGGVTTYSESVDVNYFKRTTTNPDGGTRIETYNVDGSLQSVDGTATHPMNYEYGAYDGGTWVKETKGNGSEWVTTYTDMGGHVWKTEYSDGAASRIIYNLQGQLWKQVDPDGVTTLYTYNAKGELAFTTVDPTGVNRITQTTTDVVTNSLGIIVRRTQNIVWLDGQSTGTLASLSETSVDGLKSWQVNYGEANGGKPVTNSTFTSISGSSRTTTSTAPDGSHTVSVYSYGRLISSTRYDANSVQIGGTSYTYDSHGRMHKVTDARNGTTTYGYTNSDQVITVITPASGGGVSSQTTITHYDNMLRPDYVTQPDGTTVSSVYLLTGELGLQYGFRTYPVAYSYDYAGRMQTMTNWGNFGSFAYPRVTTWNYDDQRGWLNKKTYPNANTGEPSNDGPSYTYTPAGRLKTRNWVRGVTSTYNWDAVGSLINTIYSDSTPGVTNVYDRLGRISAVSSGGMTETLTYNLANELLSESFSGGVLNGLVVTNGYDAKLRRTSLAALAGATPLVTTTYGYDNASRLQTVSDGSNSATYTYLANSPLVSQIAFKQGNTTRMTTIKQYDYLNRLKQISSVPSAAGVLPLSYNYNYNLANQRTKNTLADGSFWEYQYDTLGQVTNGVKHFADGTLVPGQSFGYLFDDIGNRQQTMIGGGTNAMRVASYGVNNLNQITNREYPGTNDIIGVALVGNGVSVNGNTNVFRKKEYFSAVVGTNNTNSPAWLGVTVASGGKTNTGNLYFPKTPEQFNYDSDGNRINDGRFNYQWDAENRITQFERPATAPTAARGKVDCQYDYRFRRTQKIVSTWSGSNYVAQSTNRFLYDGWNLVAIMNATNGPDRSFIWGTDLSGSMQGAGGVGGLISMTLHQGTNAGTYLYCYDGNGNVAALVNAANGEIAARYEYDPFLAILRATGPLAYLNPFLGSTKFYDWETGLYYYGYRYYDPLTGTWPSRDPIGEEGGKDLYGFVRNDSVNLFDRLGQDVWVLRSPSWPGHEWIVGENGDGTYWDASFGPDTPSGYGLSCCGIIKFNSRSGFDPKKLTDGMTEKDHVQTSRTVDAKVKAEAGKRSEAKKQPKYDALGNNCRDFASGMAWFARGAQLDENLKKQKQKNNAAQ